MCHLQTLHEKYSGKGLVILGFNCSDGKEIALQFIRESRATFPTILDSSETATKTGFRDYAGPRTQGRDALATRRRFRPRNRTSRRTALAPCHRPIIIARDHTGRYNYAVWQDAIA